MNYTNTIILSSAALDDIKALRATAHGQSESEGRISRIRKRIRSLSVFPERYAMVKQDPWRNVHLHMTDADTGGPTIYYLVEQAKQIVTVIRIL